MQFIIRLKNNNKSQVVTYSFRFQQHNAHDMMTTTTRTMPAAVPKPAP